MGSKLRIIVTGLIAQHPHLGGVAWDYVQYALGLARLGHDVFYFEDSGEWPYTLDGGASGDEWVARDCTANVEHLAAVMSRFGLADRWAYHFPIESCWYGLTEKKRHDVLHSADLLINVSGTLDHPENYRSIPHLAYIDSDPVFTQIKLRLDQPEFRNRVAQHDTFFSFGEHFSTHVPSTEYLWLPTRQPIVLSEWQPSPQQRDVFTTVMSWTSYKPLVFEQQTYGQKDVEFQRFLDLPKVIGPNTLEVALGGTMHTNWQTDDSDLPREFVDIIANNPDWTADRLLRLAGWQVVDAFERCADLDSYRDYISSSKAEWSIAKHGYVAGQAGWFSCRSACYLASGKPVVVQDTGFGELLPVGEGILAFTTKEQAAAAIQDVAENYDRHAQAARAIAEQYFDSDTVLAWLVERAMTATEMRSVP